MVRNHRVRTDKTLFVGVTSWNSETFIGHCIDAVRRTTDIAATRIVVLDNNSIDASRQIAKGRGVEVINLGCNQPDALNHLFKLSGSYYTLLIHADVILISEQWLDLCAAQLCENTIMISPEDIGCGPYTRRPEGKGMPESSFMLFRTSLARESRRWFRRQRFKIRWPYRAIDFSGAHITHNIPGMLAEHGFTWRMMDVHTSAIELHPIYSPTFQPKYWSDCLSFYRYGLGNFYSIDGCVTHYHNWFDRITNESGEISDDSQATFPKEGGTPVAYIRAYTRNFLADLEKGALVIPDVGRAREVDVSMLSSSAS
jgi:glycosyltransferase involved in cell wall biosynthesis